MVNAMSVIDEIKQRLDIVDVVSSYTQIKKSGNSYKGLCPFHSEKTPSFVVFPDSQSWRCFGQCGEGGDVFSFYMRAEALDFKDALRDLAKKAGVTLQQQAPEQAQQVETRDRLYGILAAMQAGYHKVLPNSPAADYAAQRGLTAETLAAFKIGYAPDEWTRALDYLRRLGYSEEEIIASGMVVHKAENNRVYDRFRNRFMIPIRDSRGRPIGFGARTLSAGDDGAKYINSPQTPLFDKSHVLFGIDQARRAIRETETAVLVEGYLDVMQAHQAGYHNVVAPMGTALTGEQIDQLAKLAKRIILALDADAAGMKATLRGLEVARKTRSEGDTFVMDARGYMQQAGRLDIDIRVLHLPEGKDPDDFIRANPDAWPKEVEAALPLGEYLIQQAVANLPKNASVKDRQNVASELLPLLSATENNVVRHENIQLLGARLQLDPRELVTWAESRTRRKTYAPQRERESERGQRHPPPLPPPPPPSPTQNASHERVLERYCLSVIIQQPERYFEANRLLREVLEDNEPPFAEGLSAEDFTYSDFRQLFTLLQVAKQQDELEPLDYLRANISPELHDTLDEIIQEPLEAYLQRAGRLSATELQSYLREKSKHPHKSAIQDEFPIRLLTLRYERLGQRAAEITSIIQEAQQDTDQVQDWNMQFSYINRKMNSLKRAIHRLQNLSTAQ